MKSLNELFDKPYKWKHSKSGETEHYTFMSDNGNEMYVKLEQFEMLEGKLVGKRRPPKKYLFNVAFGQTKKLSGAVDQIDAQTHEGDQFKIFATVIDALKHFYNQSYVGGLIVGTKDIDTEGDNIAARKKIYLMMLRKMGKGQNIIQDKEYQDSRLILKPKMKLIRNISIDRMW